MNTQTRKYLADLAARTARRSALRDNAPELLRALDSLVHAVDRQDDEQHTKDALAWARLLLERHGECLNEIIHENERAA